MFKTAFLQENVNNLETLVGFSLTSSANKPQSSIVLYLQV